MTDIDARIDADHRKAAAAEDDARAIVSRMAKIEGMDRFLASGRREHGQVPNPYRVGNLTAIGLLERHDPALANYLAAAAGKQPLKGCRLPPLILLPAMPTQGFNVNVQTLLESIPSPAGGSDGYLQNAPGLQLGED